MANTKTIFLDMESQGTLEYNELVVCSMLNNSIYISIGSGETPESEKESVHLDRSTAIKLTKTLKFLIARLEGGVNG